MSLRRKFVNGSLKDKKCPRCGVTYPRNEDFFYAKKHRTIKNAKEYDHTFFIRSFNRVPFLHEITSLTLSVS